MFKRSYEVFLCLDRWYLSYIHWSLPLIFISLLMLVDEIKSVYVRNLSPTVSPSEVEEEFKNFGRIRPDGVVIRSRKVYAFSYSNSNIILILVHLCPIMIYDLSFLLIPRTLVFVMHLLNSKICQEFIMQSRFGFACKL